MHKRPKVKQQQKYLESKERSNNKYNKNNNGTTYVAKVIVK